MDNEAVDYFEAKLRHETSPFTLKYNLEKGKVLCLDARLKEEFAAEHIPGAINIPFEELEKRLGELPKDKTIVAYGWHIACARGPKSCLLLAKNGFKPQELSGGLELWKSRGYPTESVR